MLCEQLHMVMGSGNNSGKIESTTSFFKTLLYSSIAPSVSTMRYAVFVTGKSIVLSRSDPRP
jgi:hypothetical protein